MARLLDDFARAVAAHPDKVAIVDGRGRSLTFGALKARSENLAHAWASRGIGKGDRVLLAMALDGDLYASLAALWSLGATVVLPEPAMGLKGLRHAAKVTNPRAFCSSGAYGFLKYLLPELWPATHLRPSGGQGAAFEQVDIPDDDIALISFTSGTSGDPKAIPRSHGFLSAQHRAVAPLLQSESEERNLVAFPVFVLINIAEGRTSVLPNWRMTRISELGADQLGRWIEEQSITRALLPPSLCETLAAGRIAPALHSLFTGGGPVFPDTLQRLAARKSDLAVVCVYGSTESEPIAHLHADAITPEDHAAMTEGKGLLVGHPVTDIRLRIVDNEIQVAGDHVNKGYLDPAHDAENKVHEGSTVWHRTGDAGHLDDDGRLWLLGRIGSEIALPGAQRFPFSLEVAVRQWPGVRHSAVVQLATGPCLVIEGDDAEFSGWQEKARDLGVTDVRRGTIPMDRRHASKVDRKALIRQLDA